MAMYAKRIPSTPKTEFPFQRPQRGAGHITFRRKKDGEGKLSDEILLEVEKFAKELKPEKG